MIYILNQRGTTLYKIGRTNSKIEERIKQLQTGSPFVLDLSFQLDFKGTDSLLEKTIHRRYSYLKTKGEWFDFDSIPLEEVIKNVITLSEGVLVLENKDGVQ